MDVSRDSRHAERVKVILAGLGVVVLWASAFPAIRVASPELGVLGLSFVRLAVAAIVLIAIAPFAKVRLPAQRDIPRILAASFFGMTAYQLLLNAGELSVPAGTSSIIVAAAPLVSVAIATVAFGERMTRAKVIGSAIAVGGVVAVSLARSGVSVSVATWIVIAAAVAQGIYHPMTRTLLRRYSPLEVATYCMTVGALLLVPAVAFGWHSLMSANASAWLGAVYLGVLPSAAGFVLWGYAVARLPMATATALLYLVPPVAVFLAWLWLGEVPIFGELIGGGVVIVGVVAVGLGDRIGFQRFRRFEHRRRYPRGSRARARSSPG
jgi:drug/metabolite transporter (DMT)-like permease